MRPARRPDKSLFRPSCAESQSNAESPTLHPPSKSSLICYGKTLPYLTQNEAAHFFILIPVPCIFLFCTMTNKCTINWQIITLLLHVSTLLCHPQGARSSYLAKLLLFSRLYDVSTSSCAHLTIILSSSSICLCHSSLFPLIPFPPSVL